jgi:hypothetical protein
MPDNFALIQLQMSICDARLKLMESKKRKFDLASNQANAGGGVVDADQDQEIAGLREDWLAAQIDLFDAQMKLVELGGVP